MIENTRNKVNNILNELERNSEDFSFNDNIGNESKTIDEIINIMLDNKNDVSNKKVSINNNIQSNENFDMEELLKWKNNNNNIYVVSPNWVLRSHRKLGKYIIFFKKVVRKLLRWYIEPIVEQQNKFNGSVTASINALYNNDIVTNDFITSTRLNIEEINSEILNIQNNIDIKSKHLDQTLININNKLSKLEIIPKKVLSLENEFNGSLNQYTDKISDIENEFNNAINQYTDKINVLENEFNYAIKQYSDKISDLENKELKLKNNIINKFNEIKQITEQNKTNIGSNETNLDYMEFKINQLSKTTNNNQINDINDSISKSIELTSKDSIKQINYFKFENEFRGPRKLIKENQLNYIQYFIEKNNVIDIGCGRGEFLELLKDHNIQAIGIDLYKEFIEYCSYKGLNAVYGDGIEYIKQQNDESIEGIFASQVIEHMQPEQIYSLCEESYKKLKPGCFLVMETPNPTSLSIYSNAFFIDPSHIKPVHPKTMEFYLKEVGFNDIRIIYTEQSKVDYKLPLLDGENIKNLSEFNDGINLLSDIIFGSQDYAVVARK